MKKPIIGILGGRFRPEGNPYAVEKTFVSTAYCEAVHDNGGTPLIIPVSGDNAEISQLIGLCHGLLLPGGIDVDPIAYGEAPHPANGRMDRSFDALCIHAVQLSAARKLPILGICRGLQIGNVSMGGSLYQDVSLMNAAHQMHIQNQEMSYPLHRVTIEPDSNLARILGAEEIFTNSFHHQCAKTPGKGLKIVAWAEDGIPEAMENADGSILLIQWHPEAMTKSVPEMNRLFRHLVDQASQQ